MNKKNGNIEDVFKITDSGLTYIKIIKSTNFHKINEILDVPKEFADTLVKEGVARIVTFEEYKKYQHSQAKKLFIKALKKEEKEKKKISTIGLKIDNFVDNVAQFYNQQPFFFDKQEVFWFWQENEHKWEIVDEVDLMNALDDELGFAGQTVTSGIKRSYLEAFKRIGRKKHPKEAPLKWIQFKDIAFSLNSKKIYEVKPNYFFTNPIPWELGESPNTPVMDKLFEEWVGEANVPILYEIIAYCAYRSYPIQVLFSLVGNGLNGKSCFLNLLSKFIGKDNLCSTELDLLVGRGSSRFESFKLYKKLGCQMGETNFGTLSNSSLLKKLTGGDLIGFEMKNKKPFDDYNYAKLLIASNSLPTSEDTSEGFYRRWVIIEFPNQFKEGKDILETIPKHEYSNLALKVTQILPKLLEKGEFTNQGTIKERTHRYIISSNPFSIFVDQCCDKDESTFVSYGKLYTAYVGFLKFHKKRRVKMKEFKAALEDEGYWLDRTSKEDSDGIWKSGNWITGLSLKE